MHVYVANVGMSGLSDVPPEGRRLAYQIMRPVLQLLFLSALMQQSPQHLSNNSYGVHSQQVLYRKQ